MKNFNAVLMGGTIRFSGKDILERLARDGEVTIESGPAVEFTLEYEKSEHDQLVQFSPLAWFDDSDVSIHTDSGADEPVGDNLAVYIEGPDGRSVGLCVSVDQADALARVLQNYVTAYKAKIELEKPIHVTA